MLNLTRLQVASLLKVHYLSRVINSITGPELINGENSSELGCAGPRISDPHCLACQIQENNGQKKLQTDGYSKWGETEEREVSGKLQCRANQTTAETCR